MSSLSTHVLNTVSGRPAVGVALRLSGATGVLFAGQTDADGRCPELKALELEAGAYCLEFEVAAYFRQQGTPLSDPPFLDIVPICFGLGGSGHAHVPLLVAPYAYSTYRGS
ncbi:MAG: hydroxyisourate hydrolase [Acetobacter fabarum]|jgi:5-hydroxyisourate hydrolase|uniref:hydroxyisourate hydrolase n=1 Tax=Acetobacter fabarum TaxID=483199 RepID=UPI00242D39F5|nr:hydroxyisourate hydrolase [Acetobacter fabarum]MCH4025933.1 hydroxyisourate hydrolase [Acetobacter fabarum]MCH4055978.1 hydroxyisourate hydrolase [Acetobacter fabarum]MCH4086207.1 hydroxyisourate hydrolase [Acetobacter fabarum]MCH4128849.1 hydroxyisourate hydrolase [Acetobacter fabarum]MCH4138081.1 hydroxyisourate hydrolase [Acetobacter fabarum]